MNIDLNALYEKNPEATIYVGGIDKKVTSDILWELFSQCGIVVNITLPRDKVSQDHVEYGFVEFQTEEDAEYAIKIMNMVRLYGKQLKLNKASQDKRTIEVGANIFIGNLDQEVDEKTLFDTFQNFGMILSTKIMRNTETGVSKGYGFVSYDSFESSDSAIDSMNGQFFYNRIINVQYAIKKDSKNGERHGSAAERLLAANRPSTNQFNKTGFSSIQMQQFQQQQQQQQTQQQQAQTSNNNQQTAPPQIIDNKQPSNIQVNIQNQQPTIQKQQNNQIIQQQQQPLMPPFPPLPGVPMFPPPQNMNQQNIMPPLPMTNLPRPPINMTNLPLAPLNMNKLPQNMPTLPGPPGIMPPLPNMPNMMPPFPPIPTIQSNLPNNNQNNINQENKDKQQ